MNSNPARPRSKQRQRRREQHRAWQQRDRASRTGQTEPMSWHEEMRLKAQMGKPR